MFALANRHAQPVALDQSPAFVGNGVGRLARIERGVNHAGKILQLRPKHLPIGKVPELMALQKIGGQLAHLRKEPQIALLGARCGVAALENLHQSDRFQVGLQQAEYQKEIGRIAGLLVVACAGMRRHQ